MMRRLRRAMATRSASNSASAFGLSTCLARDTFCCWSSPKPLPAPLPSLSARAQYLTDGLRERRVGADDRRLRLGGYERPRAAWHPRHRADGRPLGDRGGVYSHLISRGTIIPKTR